jgi:hypothetical protein
LYQRIWVNVFSAAKKYLDRCHLVNKETRSRELINLLVEGSAALCFCIEAARHINDTIPLNCERYFGSEWFACGSRSGISRYRAENENITAVPSRPILNRRWEMQKKRRVT